ncbi:MAG: hypothetical protein K2J67_00360 [Lachnospiraceae bacterium]|nr:hypothetical protein [Lachnospiraceae bacterium]
MGKGTKKIIFSLIGIVAAAVCVVVLYYLISEGKIGKSSNSAATESEVQKLLDKDNDTVYPETPTEVVKLYWRYNKCLYNSSMNDKKLEGMLKQLRKFYDAELLEGEGNSWDDMLAQVKKDQSSYAKKERTIASYTVQPNSTVQYAELDGRECATVISGVLTKEKSKRSQVYEKFMCRKDEDGRWRILGWQQTVDANEIAYLGDSSS